MNNMKNMFSDYFCNLHKVVLIGTAIDGGKELEAPLIQ